MKLLVILSLFIVASLATPAPVLDYLKPGQVTADNYEEFLSQRKELDEMASLLSGETRIGNSKISSGSEAKKGDYPEFCYLSIGFFSKIQVCGCWIYDKQYVVTSARCVVDCSEGQASNVTVTIPALTGKDAVYNIVKIYTPDGTNGGASQVAYAADGTPTFNTITTANVALIKLDKIVTATKWATGKDANKAKLGADADLATFNMRMKDFKIRACGIGTIGNKGERGKGVVCTDINIVTDPTLCKEPYGGEPFPIPDGQLCLQWPDRDNNVCVGDFGGPVYAYKVDLKGLIDISSQEVICTLVGSPNVRKNAPCLDGHITFCTLMSGPLATGSINAQAWINFIINPPMLS